MSNRMRYTTSGASSRDSAKIAMHSRGTAGPEAQRNRDELVMLIMALESAIAKRPRFQ